MEQQNLLNLLAVIHRDGGHYVSEHGILKAFEDAKRIVLNERSANIEMDVRQLLDLADGLLIQLCERGIYELNFEISPEGYHEVAKSALKLDNFIQVIREKTTRKFEQIEINESQTKH